jgi:endonuclease III
VLVWYNFRMVDAQDTLSRLHELPPPEKTQRVHETLNRFYGDMEWRPSIDPTSELVLTILSQHTSDINRDRAFESMKYRFPTWEEVVEAPTEELADAIRSGGLANIKAPRIQEVLRQIYAEKGNFDLTFLYDAPLDEAKAWLARFKGVGPKTAACVLMFACNRPVLPVDTHVYRVSQRLGLIDKRTSAEKAHVILEEMLEPEQRYPFHIHMITHGREVCKAPRPLCEACVVRDYCSYFDEAVSRTGWGAAKTPSSQIPDV